MWMFKKKKKELDFIDQELSPFQHTWKWMCVYTHEKSVDTVLDKKTNKNIQLLVKADNYDQSSVKRLTTIWLANR